MAKPEDASSPSPMLSQGRGGDPPAGNQLRSSITVNVPEPGKHRGSLAVIVQVPPPVTSFRHLSCASGNVPVPDMVIFDPSLEKADANPPGATHPVPTLMMSQRTLRSFFSSSASAAAGIVNAPSTPAAPATLRT